MHPPHPGKPAAPKNRTNINQTFQSSFIIYIKLECACKWKLMGLGATFIIRKSDPGTVPGTTLGRPDISKIGLW
jgi:hypothetical protein